MEQLSRLDYKKVIGHLFDFFQALTILTSLYVLVFGHGPKLLAVFVLINGMVEVVSAIIVANGHTNGFLIGIFNTFEYLFVGMLFVQSKFTRPYKRIILAMMVLIIVFSIYRFSHIDRKIFDTTLNAFRYGGMILMILFYFYGILKSEVPPALEKSPLFFVSAGFLFVSAGGLIFFFAMDYLMSVSMELTRGLYGIVRMLNVLLYISYLAAMLCIKPWNKPKPSF